ncbi:alpha/beta hydrolase [Tranquillimonas alkanivorans]|uniref:Alpha/beta hydrolase family protein n=1 Tax=Tranquillimonas alkanivorans TaxID=441119 RepID=A0A1I5MCM2_9RHOB|nr:alpha/beta hydrolase [Tranquillimonas alkanivorans]SFP07243.1 Alpha/beta hydrolase family protein [Tranquillimonas alkanivorans]
MAKKNDTAYANADFIPDAQSYPPRWTAEAEAFRERLTGEGRARLDLPYGDGERHAFDLFLPDGKPEGCVVFVHGGYWRAFDRKTWSHLAAGPRARGWAVAMPSYTLAPGARIGDITQEIAQAVTVIAEQVSGPLVLTGHSAGGHLVARMACRDVPLPAPVEARLRRVVPISPLSDLRPLIETTMNDDLRIDEDEALRESPMLHDQRRDVPVTVWVGGAERPAFLDQAEWLAEAWTGTELHVAPDRHHFDVIADLETPDSPLTRALLS